MLLPISGDTIMLIGQIMCSMSVGMFIQENGLVYHGNWNLFSWRGNSRFLGRVRSTTKKPHMAKLLAWF